MPFKTWKCPICQAQRKTKEAAPACCDTPMAEDIQAPDVKLMEKTDTEHNKSQMKDSQKILKERSRKHSTKVELEDIISNVNNSEITAKSGWLKADGRIRKAIDDI